MTGAVTDHHHVDLRRALIHPRKITVIERAVTNGELRDRPPNFVLAVRATMSLTLDDRKLLPPGVHEASLREVEKHFARFQKSDRRIQLFRKLSDYLAALKKAQCGTSVILDGSFIMACVDEPDDIDLILILPADWDATADLKPYQYNLISKRRVKKAYKIDVVLVHPGSVRQHDWTAFFSRVNVKWCERFGWPNRSTKGLVRVTL